MIDIDYKNGIKILLDEYKDVLDEEIKKGLIWRDTKNSLQKSPDDEEASEKYKSLKCNYRTLITNGKPMKALKPTKEPLHTTSGCKIPLSVKPVRPSPCRLPSPTSNVGFYAPVSKILPYMATIVSLIRCYLLGPCSGPPSASIVQPHSPYYFLKHLAVMNISRTHLQCQGNPFLGSKNMDFSALDLPVAIPAYKLAPFCALIVVLSTAVRDGSILPRLYPRLRRLWSIFCQMPSSCSLFSLLQAVVGWPYCLGMSAQRQPVVRTYRIPLRTFLSSRRGRPLLGEGGMKPWRKLHCSSVSSLNSMASSLK